MLNKQNWWQLSSIQIGGAICLPVIMIGQALSQTYGFSTALISIIIGNFILLLLGLVSAKMSHEKRKNTVENAQEYFGDKGVSFFALAMSISLLGWFGIQVNMMSLSLFDLLSIDLNNHSTLLFLLNLCFGTVITLFALKGIRALNILADISMPLLIITLAYAFFTADKNAQATEVPFSLAGVSLVIAMSVAIVIDLPTYFRHAKTVKDGLISISVIFGLIIPVLQIVGVYLASSSAGGNMLDVLKRENGSLWNLWVASFLILAGWTTNNLNLYSGVVCLDSVMKNRSDVMRTLLFGGCGTFLACLNLLNHFEIVLEIMGILVSSMGAVIITRYIIMLLNGPKLTLGDRRWHFIAWSIGIVAGLLSLKGISFTTIPVFDATIGSGLGTFLVFAQKEEYETAFPK